MYPAMGIIVRVVTLLVLLYFMIRWLGKKHLTQMTIFEYISGIVLGGAVAIHISSNTYPLLHGIIAIISWTFLIVCIDTIALKSKRFRDFVHGESKTLIHNGTFNYEQLRQERMSRDELLEVLRTRNINQLSNVEFAQLEPSGKLNVRTYETSNKPSYSHKTTKEVRNQIGSIIKDMENVLEKPTQGDVRASIEQLKQLNAFIANEHIENDEKK